MPPTIALHIRLCRAPIAVHRIQNRAVFCPNVTPASVKHEVERLHLLDAELSGLRILLELSQVRNTGLRLLKLGDGEDLAADPQDGSKVGVVGDLHRLNKGQSKC